MDESFLLKLPRPRVRRGNHERVRQSKIHEPYRGTPAKGGVEPTVEDGLDEWERWQEDRDEAQ